MKLINQVVLCFTILCVVVSCSSEQKFQIKGEVLNVEGSVLYLEHIDVSRIVLLDSVKIKKDGSFSFRQVQPEIPDFYRLRLNNQWINLVIDSTETITVKADPSDFARAYTVEGSDKCSKIKELTLLQLQADDAYSTLQKERKEKSMSDEEYQQHVIQIVDRYKEEATKYIFLDPGSTVAYFALFQQINNMLIFNPYDKADNKIFSMVATRWDLYYENSHRAKHLHALTIQAIKEIRRDTTSLFDKIEVVENLSYFDIELPDLHNNMVKLSDVVQKGNVILLDFTAQQSRFSPIHNMDLGEIYDKYKSKGLEIFQVSLDADLHLWQNAVSNLPWISLRDPESVYSRNIATYNVKELPVTFVLNRKGDIVKRIESGDNIEAEILKVL